MVRKVKTNVEAYFGTVDSSCSKQVPQTLEIQVYQKRELRGVRWGYYGVLRGVLTLKYKKKVKNLNEKKKQIKTKTNGCSFNKSIHILLRLKYVKVVIFQEWFTLGEGAVAFFCRQKMNSGIILDI